MTIKHLVVSLSRLLIGAIGLCVVGIFLYVISSLFIVAFALLHEAFAGPVDDSEVEQIADIDIPENILILRNESEYNFQSSSVHYDVRFLDETSAQNMVDSILASQYFDLSVAPVDGLGIQATWRPTDYGYEFVHSEFLGGHAWKIYTIEYHLNTREFYYEDLYSQ